MQLAQKICIIVLRMVKRVSSIFLVLTYRSELSPKGDGGVLRTCRLQSRIGKYLRYDTIYCSDNFSGFSPSNRLTRVEITNNVSATFQLLELSLVCEFRYDLFVSLITWAQRPSIKILLCSHQMQFIFDLPKEIKKDTKLRTLYLPLWKSTSGFLTSRPGGRGREGGIRNSWWGCAALFSKSWPYFRPKHAIFHTRFQTWPLKSIPVFRTDIYVYKGLNYITIA